MTRVRVEPKSCDQSRRKNDAFTTGDKLTFYAFLVTVAVAEGYADSLFQVFPQLLAA